MAAAYATPVGRDAMSACSRTCVRRRSRSVRSPGLLVHLLEQTARPLERPAGGRKRTLGREQLAGDGRVGRLAVALGDLGYPLGELVDLGDDARDGCHVARARTHVAMTSGPRTRVRIQRSAAGRSAPG